VSRRALPSGSSSSRSRGRRDRGMSASWGRYTAPAAVSSSKTCTHRVAKSQFSMLNRGASPRRTPHRRRSRGPLAPLRSGGARRWRA
jgi:hypothetical protein